MLTLSLVAVLSAQNAAAKKTIASITEKLQKIDGFMPLYIDSENGKIYIEITRWNKEFLHLASLPTGVGSNPIGLDRSQLGTTKVVFFERSGNKVLLVQPNYRVPVAGQQPEREKVG